MKYYDLKFQLLAAAFFSYSERGNREVKGSRQQQLRMCHVERNQMYLPKIESNFFCSKTLRVITNLKAKLMWRQRSPYYLRFRIARSVNMEHHATHSGRSLSETAWTVEVEIDIETSTHLSQNMRSQPPRQ